MPSTIPFDTEYNQRLFERPGIRSKLHNARFLWMRDKIAKYLDGEIRLVELGCFDGRLLTYCPWPPIKYEGFDAGWEGGLEKAQKAYLDHPAYRFHKATTPEHLSDLPDCAFNVGAALETLEHVPPRMVDGYLRQLARVIDGWLFVTVPNEKGAVFLSKWTYKRLLHGYRKQPYTFSEVLNATLGRMDKVQRNQHKGFDYAALARQISERFEVVSIEAIPFAAAPTWAAFTVGIVAQSKQR